MMFHAEDGTLVQFLDGECAPDERERVEHHLDACAECAGRLARLHHQSDLVHEALHVWDHGATRRRGSVPVWFRAAAAVLILLGIAGGVQPVRAWIVEGAQAIWSVFAGGGTDTADTPVDATPLEQASGTIAFAPVGEEFLLEIVSHQRAGTLLLEIADRSTVEAAVVAGSGFEDLIALPGGIRIANPSTSEARYVVLVPRTLALVRVTVAGESTLALAPAGAASRWEIDLAAPDAAPSTPNGR